MQVIEAPDRLKNKHSRSFEESDRGNLLLVVGGCILLFFAGLSTWGFIDPGDGYFSEAAREMIERGNYIVPHLNYQIYFSKPILIFWMIIASYKLFGTNEFAARFSSAALAMLASVVTYWCTRCIFNKRTGLIAALALSTSPLVITFARMSLIDMGFASLLGIALMSTAMTLFTSSRRWWSVIYVSLALALLDKGPAAIVMYGLGMSAFLIALRPSKSNFREILKRLNVVPGVLLTAAVAVPWYAAVAIATHGLWTQVFFLFENFGRFTGHTNHRNPLWWFYLPVVAYGFFPWMMFLPGAWINPMKAAWDRWRRPQFESAPADNAELLFACWSVAVLVFFSLSLTKLQTYVLPAWPAMAVSVGIILDRSLANKSSRSYNYVRACAWLLLATGIFCAAVSTLFTAFTFNLVHLPHRHGLEQAIDIASKISQTQKVGATLTLWTGACGLIIAGWQIRRGNLALAWKWLACAMVISGTIGGIVLYQIGYRLKNADVHCAIWAIKDKPGPVAIFRDFKPSVIYYLHRPVDTFFSTDQLHSVANPDHKANPPQYIIAGPKGAADLLAAYPTQLHTVSQSGDWYVFAATDLVAVRLPTLERSFTEHIDLSGGEFSWGTLPFAGGTKPNQ
jgi:4-amino-4-deoxy-L-arabinose transferase-like glycosyltransferase